LFRSSEIHPFFIFRKKRELRNSCSCRSWKLTACRSGKERHSVEIYVVRKVAKSIGNAVLSVKVILDTKYEMNSVYYGLKSRILVTVNDWGIKEKKDSKTFENILPKRKALQN
jgi:hypothetical protein